MGESGTCMGRFGLNAWPRWGTGVMSKRGDTSGYRLRGDFPRGLKNFRVAKRTEDDNSGSHFLLILSHSVRL